MKPFALESRWPLVAKELWEQAARPRTYLLRALYAAALSGLALFFLYGLASEGGEIPVSALAGGHGARVFWLVVGAQAAGIFLILPALMAPAIARERERNSLDLLVLTGLSPAEIIREKFFSRTIPMATLLTLSLPLLAVSMAYGGVTADMVWSSGYLLLVTCAQVGAVSLFLAADAPRTSTALLSVYTVLPLQMFFLLAAGLGVGSVMAPLFGLAGLSVPAFFPGCVLPPLLLVWGPLPPLQATVLFTLPAVFSVGFYLAFARARLTRTAFANPGQVHRPSFEIAELRASEVRRRPGDLPRDDPVAWRELSGRLMAQLRKIGPLVLTINFPALLWIAWSLGSVAAGRYEGQNPGFTFLAEALWMIGAPALGLLAAAAFADERSRQTLDVLLTTPLRTSSIVLGKIAVPRRCSGFWALLLGITALLEAVTEGWPRQHRDSASLAETACQLASSVLAIAVYLPLSVWLGAWIGMRVRDRGRAALLVLSGFAGWVLLVPFTLGLVLRAVGAGRGAQRSPWSYLELLSPATVVDLGESLRWNELLPGPPWLAIGVNFALYGGLLLWLRQHVLSRADRLLGRIPEPRVPPSGIFRKIRAKLGRFGDTEDAGRVCGQP